MSSLLAKRHLNMIYHDLTALGGVIIYSIVTLYFFLQRDYRIFLKLIFGFVLIYSVTILIRSMYFKDRPLKYEYKTFLEKLDASSFPSLHAMRITFLSAVLITYYNKLVFTVALVIITLLVYYSRMYLKKHDIIDIGGGAVLGALVFYFINAII